MGKAGVATMKTFATTLLFALASALTISTIAQSQEEPPPWAYPVNPDFKLPPDDGTVRRVPDSTVTLHCPKYVIGSSHRIGIPVIIPRCPRLWPVAGSQTCLLAVSVIAQMGLAVPRMRTSRACQRATSSSRWLTSRAVEEFGAKREDTR